MSTDPACRCGRKPCHDPAPLCGLCDVFNRRVQHVDHQHGCPGCRVRLTALPGDIADAHTLLEQLLEPRRGGQAGSGPKRPAEAPIPLAVDPYDLLANHTTPQGPIRRARLSANLDLQVGHLPVAATLGTWVRDWAESRDLGEHGPTWSVDAMARWLSERTDWAVDHHPAVDEYAAELRELRGFLFALVGRPEPDERPKPITGVPCVRCRHVTLVRHPDGDVECQWPDCSTVWRADEYERVSRAAANAVRRNKVKEAVS